MDANKLSARVNQIRDLHYGSEQQPGLHVNHEDDPCDVCDLLSAIDTGRFRLWDPVDNRPLAVTSREEVYRKALEVIRYLVRPDRPAAARFSRPTVEDIVAAALEDPPREVDPMSSVRPTRQFKTAFGTVTVDDTGTVVDEVHDLGAKATPEDVERFRRSMAVANQSAGVTKDRPGLFTHTFEPGVVGEDPDLVNNPIDELFATLYQIAGHRLLADAELTEGQRDRLSELILNVLSEPDRFEAAVVRRLYEMALKP